MRVRASTGYFRLEALGAALCKQQRAGEHRGEAAVARRQCRTRGQGTGMLVHEYVHVHISIRVYPYERIVFQSLSISPSVHIHALCTRAYTRKVACIHENMYLYRPDDRERELRHEYPHPSEVYMREYSHKHTLHIFRHTHMYTHALTCIHTRTHVHTYTHM